MNPVHLFTRTCHPANRRRWIWNHTFRPWYNSLKISQHETTLPPYYHTSNRLNNFWTFLNTHYAFPDLCCIPTFGMDGRLNIMMVLKSGSTAFSFCLFHLPYCYSVISVLSDSSWLNLGFVWQKYWNASPFPSSSHFPDEETKASKIKWLVQKESHI